MKALTLSLFVSILVGLPHAYGDVLGDLVRAGIRVDEDASGLQPGEYRANIGRFMQALEANKAQIIAKRSSFDRILIANQANYNALTKELALDVRMLSDELTTYLALNERRMRSELQANMMLWLKDGDFRHQAPGGLRLARFRDMVDWQDRNLANLKRLSPMVAILRIGYTSAIKFNQRTLDVDETYLQATFDAFVDGLGPMSDFMASMNVRFESEFELNNQAVYWQFVELGKQLWAQRAILQPLVQNPMKGIVFINNSSAHWEGYTGRLGLSVEPAAISKLARYLPALANTLAKSESVNLIVGMPNSLTEEEFISCAQKFGGNFGTLKVKRAGINELVFTRVSRFDAQKKILYVGAEATPDAYQAALAQVKK